MLTKRIIACLDVNAGRVVKGTQFVNLRDAGDPAELARAHAESGADEIVLLDIGATHEKRGILIETVRRTARELFIPFTVGGGIRALENAEAIFSAGADKISINSAAIQNPELIGQIAARFGSQAVVVAIDARGSGAKHDVYVAGGRTATGREVVEWARQAEQRGAGEILLTSMDRDGTRQGFDIALTCAVADAVTVPVIASGGVGNLQHLVDGIRDGHASAVLAASIFHFGEYSVRDAMAFMAKAGLPVRRDP
jgi:cyclase